jgi:orotidine-5'-phosphate decarboxylase
VDYKLHDTKDTVGLRVSALVVHGAKVITVHASGGVEMMKSAVEATMNGFDERRAKIYAITVLTSLSDVEILEIYNRPRLEQVEVLARMALEAGVDGIVCSALELEHLRSLPEFAEIHIVVPGTRSVGADLGQQKRSDTPKNAVANGASELVVGSQVTKAEDPEIAMANFLAEMVDGEAQQTNKEE